MSDAHDDGSHHGGRPAGELGAVRAFTDPLTPYQWFGSVGGVLLLLLAVQVASIATANVVGDARVASIVLLLTAAGAVALSAPWLGLPRRFSLMLLLPFVGSVFVLVPLWRVACLPHRYWHGTDTHFPPRTERGTRILAVVDGIWLATLIVPLLLGGAPT